MGIKKEERSLCKNKHLTEENRRTIEECLGKRMTFKAIGKLIGKDPTTVSYEIKHHRKIHRNDFVTSEDTCSELLHAPYVCNGCQKKSSRACKFARFYYRASSSQREYRELLTDAREGTALNKESFYETDRIISQGLGKGQHIYHIMANSPEIKCSKSTVYRHFKRGYYSASVMELPRAVKFKPRKCKREDYVPSGVKVGRSHDDFLAFMADNNLERHTQLDTVIGRPGGKVIMTIHFTDCNLMIGLLLNNKSSAEGASKFAALKNKLRDAGVSVPEMFTALLTDNGGEFSDVYSFENDSDDRQELHMFFCDPMCSSQKPQIEKNHTLFRDIVPKGSSFDDFSQDTVNLIFSHVNSVSRNIYKGKTPYDMFAFLHDAEILDLLGIKRIPADQVVQSPNLLARVANLSKNR